MPSFPFVFGQPLNIATGTGLSASGNSSPVSLPPKSASMAATWHIKFTVGSLTNATFTIQALNPDGTTWANVVGATSGALTVSTNLAFSVLAPGCKQLRLSYVSTGTATGSGVIVDCTTQQ